MSDHRETPQFAEPNTPLPKESLAALEELGMILKGIYIGMSKEERDVVDSYNMDKNEKRTIRKQ